MTFQEQFDKAYRLSRPAPVRALLDMESGSYRSAAALALANEGFTIDNAIDVWGWDAYNTMLIRQQEGFTWVPAANQPNIPVMPNLNFPGLPSYDPTQPPTGSIKVSLDLADYPRASDLNVTKQPFTWRNKMAAPNNPTGIGTTYNPNQDDQSPIGAVYIAKEDIPTYPGSAGIYEKQQFLTAWGEYGLWVRTA